MLIRLFTLSAAALIGVGVGLLMAPDTGLKPPGWITTWVDEHGPTIGRELRQAGDRLGSAVDVVASTVEASTDDE